jgi:hypothetical protein
MLEKEQYYLDSLNPSLNICKKAGSPLGIKHGLPFSIHLSEARRGKKNKINKTRVNNSLREIKSETRLKLSSRSVGIKVKIYDNLNNFIQEFPTLTSAAKYIGVSDRTMSRILNSGISYDNYSYKFELPENKYSITVVNNQNNSTKDYYSIRAIAKDISINPFSVSKYINTNKLLNNIYLIYQNKY